jgi:chromosome partitioning protein
VVVLVVANLKGGTGKTTTAAYIAHVLHEWGDRVLLVDADPQGSALRWAEVADWPVATTALPTPKLDRDLPGIIGDRFDAVVIDTPPLAHDRGIVVAALRAASHVVIPMAPSPIEYDRLPATIETVEHATEQRSDGRQPATAVLFTRTVANASATGVYRSVIEEDGHRVLRVAVRHLQRYILAYGQPIERAATTAYADAMEQLLGEEVTV